MLENQFKILIASTVILSVILYGARIVFWLQYIAKFKDRISLNFFKRYSPHDVYGTDLRYRRRFMKVFNQLTNAWWVTIIIVAILVALKINL